MNHSLSLLLLVAASLTLAAPPNDQISREAFKERCVAIGKLESELSNLMDIDQLQQLVLPELAYCIPYVLAEIRDKLEQLPDTTRVAFLNFAGQVKAISELDEAQDESELFVEAAATISDKLTQDHTGHQEGSSGRRLSEDEISTSMNVFCNDILVSFGDLVSFNIVVGFMNQNNETGITLSPESSNILRAAGLCRLYQRGQVQSLGIMLEILEANALQSGRKIHLRELAGACKDLFGANKEALLPEQSSKLIKRVLKSLEREHADFQPTIAKLKELREAAKVASRSCLVGKLNALSELIDRYETSKQWTIHRYLVEQSRKQVEFCRNDQLDDIESMKLRLAKVQNRLHAHSSEIRELDNEVHDHSSQIEQLHDRMRAHSSRFERFESRLQQLDDEEQDYSSQLERLADRMHAHRLESR